jgi:hypothetical protein
MPSGEHNRDRWRHRLTTEECTTYTARDLASPRSLTRFDDGRRWLVVERLELKPGGTFADMFTTFRRNSAPRWLRIIPVPQHFGGVRWLLVCTQCNRGALKLYGHATFGVGRALCRKCGNLTYQSRRLTDAGRFALGAAKCRARVVGPHWQRPVGMHRGTYERIISKGFAYEDAADGVVLARIGAFVARIEKRNG